MFGLTKQTVKSVTTLVKIKEVKLAGRMVAITIKTSYLASRGRFANHLFNTQYTLIDRQQKAIDELSREAEQAIDKYYDTH